MASTLRPAVSRSAAFTCAPVMRQRTLSHSRIRSARMANELPREAIDLDHTLPRPRRAQTPSVRRPKPTPEELEIQRRREQEYEFDEWVRQSKHDLRVRLLQQWAAAHSKRDEIIRAALKAGVSEREVHRITGVARTTVARIVSKTEQRRGLTSLASTTEDRGRQ